MKVTKVEKARKDYPEYWIKKWESYYFWSFRYWGKKISKEYPTRRQLTQNWFLLSLYDIEEQLNSVSIYIDEENPQDNIDMERQSILDEIQNLLDEQQDKLDNMPEHLQESSSSWQLLQERIDWLQEWYDEIEGIDIDIDEDLSKEEKEEKINEILEELKNTSHNL